MTNDHWTTSAHLNESEKIIRFEPCRSRQSDIQLWNSPMESTLCTMSKTLASTSNTFFFTSSLHRRFPKALFSQCLRSRLTSPNLSSPSLRALSAFRSPLRCFSSSAASFAAGGGGGGPNGEFGGDGGGGDGGDTNPKAAAAEEVTGFSPDVIILDVGVSIFVLFCFRFLSKCCVSLECRIKIGKMVVREWRVADVQRVWRGSWKVKWVFCSHKSVFGCWKKNTGKGTRTLRFRFFTHLGRIIKIFWKLSLIN